MITCIRGGMVYDGSGEAPREADVIIQGGTIARIAPRLPAQAGANIRANTVIEAKGMLVTPGFVDVGNHADHYGTLAADPAGTELVTRGITSIVVGNSGASLAPLAPGSLAPFAWWGNAASHAAHATTVREFLSFLAVRRGVNVGTLLGYATVREGILRGATRDCTDREFELLEATLALGMKEGALGISVNLEYMRTSRAPRHELLACARAAARAEGVFAIRLREREEGVNNAFAEIIAISEETKANILISHLEPYAAFADHYRELLASLTRESSEHHINFDTSARGVAAVPLPLFLPNHLREPAWSAMTAHLREPSVRAELKAHLKQYRDLPITIAAVADPSLKLFEGTRFDEWTLHEHAPFEDALIRFMEVSGLRAVVAARVADAALAGTCAAHDRAFIASGDAAAPALETSTYGDFLAHAPAMGISVEQAIAKMTSLPALKFKLKHRGLLREGYRADVLVMEGSTPREVFVNGVRAVADGAPTGICAGAVLKG